MFTIWIFGGKRTERSFFYALWLLGEMLVLFANRRRRARIKLVTEKGMGVSLGIPGMTCPLMSWTTTTKQNEGQGDEADEEASGPPVAGAEDKEKETAKGWTTVERAGARPRGVARRMSWMEGG